MATRKQIDYKFTQLCELSGMKKTENCDSYLGYDFNSIYGGYSLFKVIANSGAQHNSFNVSACNRYKSNEFYQLLSGLVNGIEYANRKK